MNSYLDFLSTAKKQFGDDEKFKQYFLNSLVSNLDKAFVVDLSRVIPFTLPPEFIIKESIEFIDFAIKSPDIIDLSHSFQSFVVH